MERNHNCGLRSSQGPDILYFHYCVQVLRPGAWQQTLASEVESSIDTFVNQHHEPYWAASGKYINKKMLRSFVEELGHIIPSNDYKYLLKGGIE